MKKTGFHRNILGVTLIELIITIAIIAILAAIGVPQYGRFSAKSKTRKAANDVLQNMRLARTMAIQENIPYMIVFNADNTYNISGDVNRDGDIDDVVDEYGGTGAVKVVDVQAENGHSIIMGSANFSTGLPSGPNGIVLADAASFTFNPDGTVNLTGAVYFQESNYAYTYCTELINATGKIDLYSWQGHIDDSANANWFELR